MRKLRTAKTKKHQHKKSLKKLFIYIWHELKDWHTLLLFGIVCLVVGVEVWLPFLLGLIFKNAYLLGIAAICEAFWLAPLTPFLPICIGITLAIKKPIENWRRKRKLWKKLKWLI